MIAVISCICKGSMTPQFCVSCLGITYLSVCPSFTGILPHLPQYGGYIIATEHWLVPYRSETVWGLYVCSRLSDCQKFLVRAVSSNCINGFWYCFTQLFSITRWCAMNFTQPPTPKVKVIVLAQTFSIRNSLGCIFNMLGWILILLHTTILHKMMCHEQQPATYSQGQGHNLGSTIFRLYWRVRAVSSKCLNGFW